MAGLQVLNDPEGATVDIVFVHGLHGNHLTSLTKKLSPLAQGPAGY